MHSGLTTALRFSVFLLRKSIDFGEKKVDLLYFLLYCLINFIASVLIVYLFADKIGKINYEFCKSRLDLPIKNNSNKEWNFFPQKSFIHDRSGGPYILYQVLYKICYKLHICNYIISLSNVLISLTGLILVNFFDVLWWILIAIFSAVYLLSVFVLFVIVLKVSSLRRRVKKQ